jgi:anti-sigma-K factor RskA
MRPDAHTLVAAYAADALEQSERADVEAHLAECDVCRDDLRGFREALAALAHATAEAPPARMREAVMARVRTTAQLPPLTADLPPSVPVAAGTDSPAGTGAPAGDRVDSTPAAPDTAVPDVPGPRARGPLAGSGRALFALAASVLTVVALGAGIWGVSTAGTLSDVRAQQAAVQRVLAAEDVVSLSGTPQLADGVVADEVVVLASRSEDAALLLPAGLPEAPEGRTWQAWTVNADGARSAGVFDVAGGEAVALSGSLADADAVAVSLEPRGGSEAPTTDPVLVVPLT